MFGRPRPDPDLLLEWLETCCHRHDACRGEARTIWLDWKRFADRRGAEPGTPRSFSNELRKLGHPRQFKARGTSTKVHVGLALTVRPLPRTPWGDIII